VVHRCVHKKSGKSLAVKIISFKFLRKKGIMLLHINIIIINLCLAPVALCCFFNYLVAFGYALCIMHSGLVAQLLHAISAPVYKYSVHSCHFCLDGVFAL